MAPLQPLQPLLFVGAGGGGGRRRVVDIVGIPPAAAAGSGDGIDSGVSAAGRSDSAGGGCRRIKRRRIV